jgi:uncharacterized membrane protein YhaH (DUF805 family)
MFGAIFSARIGRAQYWQRILLTWAVTGGLIGVIVSLLFSGSLGLGGLGTVVVLTIGLLLVIGLWGRIVMMQRCRDADWPLWLPWALYGGSLLASFTSGFSVTNFNAGALLAQMGFLMAIGLADFVVTVALGVVPSANKPTTPSTPSHFDGPPRPSSGPMETHMPIEESRDSQIEREDAAIARALAEYRARQNGEAPPTSPLPPETIEESRAVPAPAQIVSAPPRPAGFGRKGL